MNPTRPHHAATPIGAALALVLAAAVLLAVPRPAAALSTYTNVEQLAVDTFVEAGLAVSQRSFDPETTDAVVLATQQEFPDGLSASAVAGAAGAPVLFTAGDALNPDTGEEIDRLLDDGDTVFVMGGTDAIRTAVTDALDAYAVVRLAGDSRIETAIEAADQVGIPADGRVLIARAFGPDGAGTTSDRTTGWVDAISCGAYAAAEGIPILLTQTEVLTGATRDHLAGSTATHATVCGGTEAVSDSVLAELIALGLDVDRVEGITRVETAIDVAQDLFGLEDAAGNAYAVVPGYGESFGYGLAVAPLGLPILLVGAEEPTACLDGSQPSRATLCYLANGEGDPAEVLLVGDESIISDPVANAVGEAAGGVDITTLPELAAPADVTAEDDVDDDGTRLTVSWTAPADPDDILDGYTVYVDDEVAAQVDADTTEIRLEELEPEEQVTITVTATDIGNRESARSTARLATPEDEVPTALTGFVADAGDDSVRLSWNPGPVDTASYDIERATVASGGACGEYADLTTISDPDTLTYTDDTAGNGTTYCYRITVTDAADQTSPAATSDPVTPAPGTPSTSLQYPVGDQSAAPGYQGDTVHYGAPLTIEYTVTDTDDEPADLRVTLEMSYGGGAAGTYVTLVDDQPVQFVTAGEDGEARLTVPSCAPGDTTSTTCIRDQSTSELAFRITVEDPGGRAERVSSGPVQLVRTPPAVTGLAVTAAEGRVDLVWDRVQSVAGLPILYRITRAEVAVAPDSDASNEACPTTDGSYTFLKEVPQPPSGATVGTTDPEVDADGQSIGGTQINDYLYCYRVVVERTPELRGPAVLGSANPLTAPGLGVAIQTPSNGGKLDRGETETIRYQLTVPDGATVTDVQLFYCLDYDSPDGLSDDECLDSDGFKEITTRLTPAEPPRAEGSNTVSWAVPADASTAQGDGETGALMITATATGAESGSARVTGIIFS